MNLTVLLGRFGRGILVSHGSGLAGSGQDDSTRRATDPIRPDRGPDRSRPDPRANTVNVKTLETFFSFGVGREHDTDWSSHVTQYLNMCMRSARSSPPDEFLPQTTHRSFFQSKMTTAPFPVVLFWGRRYFGKWPRRRR